MGVGESGRTLKGLPGKHLVTAWNREYDVSVYQKSKAVWEAAGNYAGEPITVTDS
jgi:hypothetical protein